MPGIDMNIVNRKRSSDESNQDQNYDDENLDYDTDDGEEEEAEVIERPSKQIDKRIIVVGIAVALVTFLIIAYVVGSNSSDSDDSGDYGYTSEGYRINGDGTMTLDDGSVVEYYDPALADESSGEDSDEEDDYSGNDYTEDESEAQTSTNGVYDINGNLIVDDKSEYLEPGDNDYSSSLVPDENGELSASTSATVYSSTDFIKDLNGVNIPAVYTVKEISTVYMNVNYEKRRAIVDDGMELYWVEINYNDKRYRCTTTFARFKALKNSGICRVVAEMLTLENGEHIISYMRIVDDNEGYTSDEDE